MNRDWKDDRSEWRDREFESNHDMRRTVPVEWIEKNVSRKTNRPIAFHKRITFRDVYRPRRLYFEIDDGQNV
jgi:hypothetical protein